MQSTVNILKAYGAVAVQAIKQDLEKVKATGKTQASIRFDVKSEGATDTLFIYGRPFTPAVETGRGPRKSSELGNFQDNMLEWVRIRFPGLDNKKQIRLAKFFRWKINKQGDKTHRQGGREVYSHTLDKVTEEIKMEVKKDFRINFSNFIKNSLRGSNAS